MGSSPAGCTTFLSFHHHLSHIVKHGVFLCFVARIVEKSWKELSAVFPEIVRICAAKGIGNRAIGVFPEIVRICAAKGVGNRAFGVISGGSEYDFEGESRPTATFFGKKAEKSRFFLFFVTINVKGGSLNRKMCPFDSTISTELS